MDLRLGLAQLLVERRALLVKVALEHLHRGIVRARLLLQRRTPDGVLLTVHLHVRAQLLVLLRQAGLLLFHGGQLSTQLQELLLEELLLLAAARRHVLEVLVGSLQLLLQRQALALRTRLDLRAQLVQLLLLAGHLRLVVVKALCQLLVGSLLGSKLLLRGAEARLRGLQLLEQLASALLLLLVEVLELLHLLAHRLVLLLARAGLRVQLVQLLLEQAIALLLLLELLHLVRQLSLDL
mmetsp:Transcript_11824/g.47723  ORF Transcript_11824/g.47723 Transcript_11824/m.47723 type:complete len:238 (-) Transcript_11824:410-1123(-)